MTMTRRIHSWTMRSSRFHHGSSTTSATTSCRRANLGSGRVVRFGVVPQGGCDRGRHPGPDRPGGAGPSEDSQGATGERERPRVLGGQHQPSVGGAVARRTAFSTAAYRDRFRVGAPSTRSALRRQRRCRSASRAAWAGAALASDLSSFCSNSVESGCAWAARSCSRWRSPNGMSPPGMQRRLISAGRLRRKASRRGRHDHCRCVGAGRLHAVVAAPPGGTCPAAWAGPIIQLDACRRGCGRRPRYPALANLRTWRWG